MAWQGSQEGKSVATLWAEMVQAAEGGEVVAIANRHGDDVAVMVGIREWEEIQQRILELEQKAGEVE